MKSAHKKSRPKPTLPLKDLVRIKSTMAKKTKPSAEEVNQAIAEELGWVWYRLPKSHYDTRNYRFLALPSIHEYEGQDPAWTVRADMTEKVCNWEYMQREFHVPNYWGDLNACHEMEKWLDDKPMDTRSLWYDYLGVVVGWNGANNQDDMRFECFYLSARATAPQRCEAFLRTLGKWRWV
jgi:hypothetical protein